MPKRVYVTALLLDRAVQAAGMPGSWAEAMVGTQSEVAIEPTAYQRAIALVEACVDWRGDARPPRSAAQAKALVRSLSPIGGDAFDQRWSQMLDLIELLTLVEQSRPEGVESYGKAALGAGVEASDFVRPCAGVKQGRLDFAGFHNAVSGALLRQLRAQTLLLVTPAGTTAAGRQHRP